MQEQSPIPLISIVEAACEEAKNRERKKIGLLGTIFTMIGGFFKDPFEQYQLIMECRSSGLSDYQWCTEHNINPGTFYNWVKRLRKKACYDIPSATGRGDYKPSLKQDVVKLEVIPDHQNSVIPTVENTILPLEEPCPAIEVMLGTVSIKISNDVDPKLLSQILKAVTGTC